MTDTITLVVIITILVLGLFGLSRIIKLSLRGLAVLLSGSIVGLLIGALISLPLGRLPDPLGSILPIVVSLLATLIMIRVFHYQEQALIQAFAVLPWATQPRPPKTAKGAVSKQAILVDTSVIIDGRIADIAKAGFVPGKMLVPRFVLAELQNIADSDDAMRRGRGRRGLEMLNQIQETPDIEMEVIEEDVSGIKEVDAKLVALGKKLGANILTTDYNLNRVAQIEGVRVLNINELSNAIRPVVLPGEEMTVKIVQTGKERNQGVGYLPDGTMIVVENGDKLIGTELSVEVTRVFQTVAGKMIFAAPKKSGLVAPASKRRGLPVRRRPRDQNSSEAIEDRIISENNSSSS